MNPSAAIPHTTMPSAKMSCSTTPPFLSPTPRTNHAAPNLDALLAACRQHGLIDGFEPLGDRDVVIRLGRARYHLDGAAAAGFLQGVLRYAQDLQHIAALFAFAAHPVAVPVRA